MTKLSKIWKAVLDVVFPPLCLNCRAYLGQANGKVICGPCLNKIAVNKTLFRPEADFILGAATDYSDKLVQALIHVFKYQFLTAVREPLGEILSRYLKISSLGDFLSRNRDRCLILPIPLHPLKEKRRGFNQAELLAEEISLRFNLPMETKLLARIKKTREQAKLKNNEERLENLKGGFKIIDSPTKLKEKIIVLVDDVYTSGSTMKEARRTLKRAGAHRVLGLVVARASDNRFDPRSSNRDS